MTSQSLQEIVQTKPGLVDPPELTPRQRFLRACHCLPVDRPPVWLMRQAGRVLPEYRALKAKHTFIELAQTPELAAEVTIQPIRRFHFDAAIIFSDILVISEALGYPYQFKDGGGVWIERRVNLESDIRGLPLNSVEERLSYVGDAIRLVRQTLGRGTALLGFSGSPWTLSNFMLEQGSAREFQRAKQLFHLEPALFSEWMEVLTESVIRFLQLQIDAGVDAVQIFDSLGGVLPPGSFQEASGRWMGKIIAGLGGQVPVIVFSKGTHSSWDALLRTRLSVLGLDWGVDLAAVSAQLPEDIAVQGNLDPALLQTTPAVVAAETRGLLARLGERLRRGYIFNLGHGVPAGAKLENIEALLRTIQES